MAESSDEEKGNSDNKGGRLSPRTMLAIQEALAEEEDDSSGLHKPLHNSPSKLQITERHHTPLVVVSSSEDEANLSALSILPSENGNEEEASSQNVHLKDSLLVSSSEDELDEVAISQRSKAVCTTLMGEVEEEGEKKEELGDGRRTESEKQEDLQTRAALNGDLIQQRGEAVPRLRELPISSSAETENELVQKTKETNEVKSEAADDSESEGTAAMD